MDSERGYSLLELSLAVAISAALFTGFFATVAAVNGTIQSVMAESIIPLQVAQALDQMVDDIEQAEQVQFDAIGHTERGFRVALGYGSGTPRVIAYEATTSEGVVSVLNRLTYANGLVSPSLIWEQSSDVVRASLLPRGVMLNRRTNPADVNLLLMNGNNSLQPQDQPLFPVTWDGNPRTYSLWYGHLAAPEITIRLIYRATANSAPSYAVTYCFPKLQR